MLNKSIFYRLEKRRQAEEVLAAGIEGIWTYIAVYGEFFKTFSSCYCKVSNPVRFVITAKCLVKTILSSNARIQSAQRYLVVNVVK